MSEIKYCIHEGYVTSKNDGEEHFITGARLIELYHLNPSECKITRYPFDSTRNLGMNHDGLQCLYPRYDGDYSL